MKPSVFLSTALFGLLALPAVASAQDQAWLKDRRYTEGPGYQVGDFELHPGAALEFGYDSNYLRVAPNPPPGQDVLGALRLRLTPSLSFTTLGAQRRESAPTQAQPSIIFKGALSATYNEFIPLNGTPSEKDSLRNERNIGVNADLSLNILPGHQWSGLVTGSFARILTPGENGVNSSGSSADSFNRDVPQAGAELIWTPGSGLFEWRLGYQFTGTFFEGLSQLTNVANQIETRGRWRFLPRTSLVYDARFGFIDYTSPSATCPTGSTASLFCGKTSSHPMRALIGVNGLVTSSFSVLAMVGWGASFYTPATVNNVASENFDSAIGQVELKWYLTPNPAGDAAAVTPSLSAISVGFTRDFYDAYIGTYLERDRGYASLSYFYNGRFLLVLDGGGAPIIYPRIPSLQPQSPTGFSFTDIRIDASLFGEYRFKDAFGINATVRYNQNIDSATNIRIGNANQDLSYREVEAYLGARWLM